mmetsp:Transcript_9227/g.18801  ORF Transcript_9227/g.18801 Transcript_9227/m.18801 type:complete len:202 (-) Transcript_9227:187-792(-)
MLLNGGLRIGWDQQVQARQHDADAAEEGQELPPRKGGKLLKVDAARDGSEQDVCCLQHRDDKECAVLAQGIREPIQVPDGWDDEQENREVGEPFGKDILDAVRSEHGDDLTKHLGLHHTLRSDQCGRYRKGYWQQCERLRPWRALLEGAMREMPVDEKRYSRTVRQHNPSDPRRLAPETLEINKRHLVHAPGPAHNRNHGT